MATAAAVRPGTRPPRRSCALRHPRRKLGSSRIKACPRPGPERKAPAGTVSCKARGRLEWSRQFGRLSRCTVGERGRYPRQGNPHQNNQTDPLPGFDVSAIPALAKPGPAGRPARCSTTTPSRHRAAITPIAHHPCPSLLSPAAMRIAATMIVADSSGRFNTLLGYILMARSAKSIRRVGASMRPPRGLLIGSRHDGWGV